MKVYNEEDIDPWELLLSTVMRVEQLEDEIAVMMDSAKSQMGIIQHLLYQNQQLSIQGKELTDYVTNKLRS